MQRRQFLKTSMAAAAAASLPQIAFSRDPLDLDVRIEKVHCFRVMYDRPRIVAGNSQYKLAGGQRGDWVIALYGNNGQLGIGPALRYGRPTPSDFPIGKTVGELLGSRVQETADSIGTSAVWDLAGKSLGKPVYELLGGRAKPEGVRVYDGSIYMEELVNRDANSAYRNPNAPYGRRPNWQEIFREAIDVSREQGHNFVKVKIGRGSIHLSREAGNLQDAAVLRFIREYAGDDYSIGVDANNGYRPEDAHWLLREHGDLNLAFVEEMFPESIEEYRALQETILQHNLKTHVADGENWRTPHDPGVPELIEAGVIDVLQGDMRMFQIEGILEEARLAKEAGHGAQIAPHNWGAEFAFYIMIHMGLVIDHYYGAEHDPGTQRHPILVKEGYEIRDGYCNAPNSPGFGVELNHDLLEHAEHVYSFEA